MDRPLITVFTPTYNRAQLLPRLFKSLCQQADHNFEWLIVDDGSTDGTESVVNGFQAETFAVRYVWKENGGKHTAYNLALKEARGEFFFCVDSDDFLAPDVIRLISEALRPATGLCAYKASVGGRLLSTVFPNGAESTTTFDLYEKLGCRGEYAFIYPTHIARQVPFPVFSGERFVTESVVFDQLDQHCPVLLLPEVITICEYQTSGYSADTDRLMHENPAGYCLYYMQRIDRVSSLPQRIAAVGKYRCFGRMAGSQRSIYNGNYRLLVSLCAPLGILFEVYYHLIRGI